MSEPTNQQEGFPRSSTSSEQVPLAIALDCRPKLPNAPLLASWISMKQFATTAALALILVIPANAQMNLHGITATNKVNTFSSSHELLRSSAPTNRSTTSGSNFVSTRSYFTGSSSSIIVPSHSKTPDCPSGATPEPASIAALAIGVGAVVRRKKAARG